MKTSDFNYHLPPELIAQTPAEPRDSSRLMVLDRSNGSITHHHFPEITAYLKPGDVLVFNDSRVIPARLQGRKADTGGKVEILLLQRITGGIWEALVKPAKRLSTGTVINIETNTVEPVNTNHQLTAQIAESRDDGLRVLSFSEELLPLSAGRIALPPYIHHPLEQPERYQTVYARDSGSVAAPTAGLHFTPGLLDRIKQKGIECLFVTLHIGLDTFRPVREEDPCQHLIHREYGVVSTETARRLTLAREEGRRIICVGTTSVRLIEQSAQLSSRNQVSPFSGWVSLYILPGYNFRMIDALITNFHLPESTLLMLVTAFTGREFVLKAYNEAIALSYRFYSFGDAMLIL